MSVVVKRSNHDDVIKWEHVPRYCPFARGIHWSPVNFPHKSQWCGALMFSLTYTWINGWVNWWFETPSRPLWSHCNDDIITPKETIKQNVIQNKWVNLCPTRCALSIYNITISSCCCGCVYVFFLIENQSLCVFWAILLQLSDYGYNSIVLQGNGKLLVLMYSNYLIITKHRGHPHVDTISISCILKTHFNYTAIFATALTCYEPLINPTYSTIWC